MLLVWLSRLTVTLAPPSTCQVALGFHVYHVTSHMTRNQSANHLLSSDVQQTNREDILTETH